MLEARVRARALCLAGMHDAYARGAARRPLEDGTGCGWAFAIRIQATAAGLAALRAKLRWTCPACLVQAEWSREATGCADHRDLMTGTPPREGHGG